MVGNVGIDQLLLFSKDLSVVSWLFENIKTIFADESLRQGIK